MDDYIILNESGTEMMLDDDQSNNNKSSSDNNMTGIESEDDNSLAIAMAYRDANGEDQRLAMNVMAETEDIQELLYYVVPCTWMKQHWELLNGRSADESSRQRHSIDNLALCTGQVSDDDEDEATISKTAFYAAKRRRSSATPTLNPNFKHEQDYCLVGKSVWLLLSQKFGHDVELCKTATKTHQNEIIVDCGHEQIPLPHSGHFSYFQHSRANHPQRRQQQQLPSRRDIAVAAAEAVSATMRKKEVVSDDDDDNNNNINNSNNQAGDDDEDDDTELYGTSLDAKRGDSNGTATATTTSTSTSTTSNAIILLPPSQQAQQKQHEEQRPVLKRKRYGSGLGNLGNTCFMNSTLQCLAHTEPLRRYFVTGEYRRDLNRDNPLGTGGELAVQFADLLTQMFEDTGGYGNGVVYPRQFKSTLGKHAEQFMGYDQHDSQELATYLLDALHEDTNRVTKKPYIEKPEQGDDEPDDVAADKAWNLHLKREDSRVLNHFMGQVKSRVQCPKPGCGRVSTTFDPFMYLSVPIPGATERTIDVTFVPLQGPKQLLKITMSKTGKIITLLTKLSIQWKQFCREKIELRDLVACDVFQHKVYTQYRHNEDVDRIKANDKTFVYQLIPESEFHHEEHEKKTIIDEIKSISIPLLVGHNFKLSTSELARLNHGDNWKQDLDLLMKRSFTMASLLNRGTLEDRIRVLREMAEFLEECSDGRPIKSLAESDDDEDSGDNDSKTFFDISEQSPTFIVNSYKDVAKLRFIAKKFQTSLLKSVESTGNECCVIQIYHRTKDYSPRRFASDPFVDPLCIRIPAYFTVYQLREHLAERLPIKKAFRIPSNCVNGIPLQPEHEPSHENPQDDKPKEPETFVMVPMHPENGIPPNGGGDNPELLVMRQIPFSYERRSRYSSFNSETALGMLDTSSDFQTESRPISLANHEDHREKAHVAEYLGAFGTLCLNWPNSAEAFDVEQYNCTEDMTLDDDALLEKRTETLMTVEKCIDKYCQMEQLEESEMWYCNKCKEHVRAWKQFHIYRSPPILIIHLKRFHYSSSTHRREKIDGFIDFPLEGLDLTEAVMHWSEEEKPIYDCYAVSNHYGGLGGGHYTAYAMSDDDVWCHFDDSRVTTRIDPNEVVSRAAYVLYYRRRDVVFETSDFDVPIPVVLQEDSSDSNNVVVGGYPVTRSDSMELDDAATSKHTSPMGSVVQEDGDDDETEYEYEDDDDPVPQ